MPHMHEELMFWYFWHIWVPIMIRVRRPSGTAYCCSLFWSCSAKRLQGQNPFELFTNASFRPLSFRRSYTFFLCKLLDVVITFAWYTNLTLVHHLQVYEPLLELKFGLSLAMMESNRQTPSHDNAPCSPQ